MYQTPPRPTSGRAAAGPGSERQPPGTINTGQGKREKRLQLWRPMPLSLASTTTATEAFSGKQPSYAERQRA